MKSIALMLTALAGAVPALAQTSDIDPANKLSWQESSGWMNWRDANGSAQGVHDRGTALSGFIWCENIGWVNVGSGSPANGISYANTSGADTGVNISSSGSLSGLAWSENTGWINFSGGALATPPQPALFDLAAQRFRGYAWGENIGWVNLDVATTGEFVKRVCFANCDASSAQPVLNANDFQCFLNKFAAGDAYANCDRSNVSPILNANDFQCFLNAFAAGCP